MKTMTGTRQVVEQIVVEMSEEDAQDILDILGHIGGSPEGPRGAASRLLDALHMAGIRKPMMAGLSIRAEERTLYIERREKE